MLMNFNASKFKCFGALIYFKFIQLKKIFEYYIMYYVNNIILCMKVINKVTI